MQCQVDTNQDTAMTLKCSGAEVKEWQETYKKEKAETQSKLALL